VDPGSRKTGFGFIDWSGRQSRWVNSGCLKLPEKMELPDRLVFIAEKLEALVQAEQPDCAVIEQMFVAKHARAGVVLGHVRGAILLTLARLKLPLHEYPPLQVKQTVVGVGSADKQQVGHMVRVLLNLKQVPQEDEADALAVAITHAHNTSSLALQVVPK
jgi:crossover junction endodeoxyribonuclease RuvC